MAKQFILKKLITNQLFKTMKKKYVIAIVAMACVLSANLFLISAQEGNVRCKELLVKSLSLNKIAYASDPGEGIFGPRGPQDGDSQDCSKRQDGGITTISFSQSTTTIKGRNLLSEFDVKGGASLTIKKVPISLNSNGFFFLTSVVVNEETNQVSGSYNVDLSNLTLKKTVCTYKNYTKCEENPNPCQTLMDKSVNEFKSHFLN